MSYFYRLLQKPGNTVVADRQHIDSSTKDYICAGNIIYINIINTGLSLYYYSPKSADHRSL